MPRWPGPPEAGGRGRDRRPSGSGCLRVAAFRVVGRLRSNRMAAGCRGEGGSNHHHHHHRHHRHEESRVRRRRAPTSSGRHRIACRSVERAPWFSHHMQRGPRLGTSAGFLSECESLPRPVALYAHANITDVAADSNWPNEGSYSRSQKVGDRVILSDRGVELARLRPNHG